MIDILCIGHAAYDLSVFVQGFPAEDSKGETDCLLEGGGGPAANAAYLVAAWGMPCAFAGLIGDDRYGRRILDEFRAVGTEVSLVESRPGYPTPASIILVNLRNGSRTVINRKIAGSPLAMAPASLAALAPRFLLFDGHELEAALTALRFYPQATSILDAGSWREGTAALAGKVDYLVASEKFARQACQLEHLHTEADRRTCIRLLRERFDNATVVTLGERGLVADEGPGYFHLPAFPAQTVDTTAAGDIFHGAFTYGLAGGMDFKEGLRFASMAASLSVRKRGGRVSIPALNEVKEALAHVN